MKNIVVGIFILIFAFGAMKSCKRQKQIASWPTINAEVIDSEVESETEWKTKKKSDGRTKRYKETEYFINVTYRYEVNGQNYTNSFETDDYSSRSQAASRLRQYAEGKQISIKYNPENPSDSVRNF